MQRWVVVGFLGSWAAAQSFLGAAPKYAKGTLSLFPRPVQVLQAPTSCAPDSFPNPRVALWLSALLPGAGQIYNRSYWKAPLIWGALALTGTLTYQNHKNYLRYRQAYRDALEGRNPFPTLPPENLRFIRESYRKDRDIFLLATLLVYALQIGEAYADAHLKGFTIYAGGGVGYVRVACAW